VATTIPKSRRKSVSSAITRSALNDYCQKTGIECGVDGNPVRDILVAEGEVVETIMSNAEEFDASMIVLGTHEGFNSKSVISKVVENVLKNPNVPVLIVPHSFNE